MGHLIVEISCRFVRQDQGRVIHHGPGNGHPLFFSGREGENRIPFPAEETYPFQDLQDPPLDLSLGMAGDLEGKGNIFTYGSVFQELEILKNHSDRSSELMDLFETLLA